VSGGPQRCGDAAGGEVGVQQQAHLLLRRGRELDERVALVPLF
jgi:hypothetical protein